MRHAALVLTSALALAGVVTSRAVRPGPATRPSPAAVAPSGRAPVAALGALPLRDATVGAQRVYAVTLRSRAEMRGAAPTEIELAGRLRQTVVAVDPGRVTVRAELASPAMTVRAGARAPRRPAPEALAPLGRPFVITQSPDGRVLDLAFDRSTGAPYQALLRSVVDAAQVVVPAGDAARWQSEEGNLTGRYLAAYERDADGVHKSTLRYVALDTSGAAPVDAGRVRASARATITLDAGAWPATIEANERLDLDLGGALPPSTSSRSARLRLVDRRVDRAAVAAFPAERASMVRPAAPAASRDVARRLDEQLVAGARYEDLARALREHLGDDGVRARAQEVPRLGALLRLEPAAVSRALQDVRATDAPAADALLAGLAAAGTPEAQRALATVVEDADLPAERRAQGAIGLGLTRGAPADTVTALARAGEAADPAVATPATLALGNAARNGAEGDPAALLLDRLAAATTPEARALVLTALGNSGDPRAMPAIEAALTAPEPRLRAAAVEALRFMTDPAADEMLATALRTDPSVEVRLAAVDAAGYRAIGPLMDALGDALTRDGEAQVRAAVVRLLGRHRDDPGALALLRAAAERDPIEGVRAAAQALLTHA